jgi:hypothetical protein
MNLDIENLRARQKRLNEEIAQRQKELEEIEIALRVFDKYADKAPDKGKAKGKATKPGLPPRPKGTPSTFDMVNLILASAEKGGKGPLTSRELMDEIRANYWPGVQNKQILPSIFGFAKAKRLIRDGDKWRRNHEALKKASTGTGGLF